jgi:hypothetical protein
MRGAKELNSYYFRDFAHLENGKFKANFSTSEVLTDEYTEPLASSSYSSQICRYDEYN